MGVAIVIGISVDLSKVKIGLEGVYQQENAALAIETFLLFMAARNEAIDADSID